MATHDYNIANASGQAVRQDLNNVLAAIQSTNSNATAPATTVAHQLWYDTSENKLKIRNAANDGWVDVVASASGALVGSSSTRVQVTPGTQALPSVYFGTNTTSGFYAPTNLSDNEIALSLQDHTYLKIGYNVAPSGNTPNRALFLGNAASQQSPVKPKDVTDNNATTNQGLMVSELGRLQVCAKEGPPIEINRTNNDGNLIGFYGSGSSEGAIVISGSTVSLVGSHLSRWSQLPGNAARTEILRGTVLSNIDEMCEWGTEDNPQLNRCKVSEVEGDPNAAGVFQSWDDDDETYTKDLYIAMTGDFVIRIAQGTTVARGDLLMSASDGTAKPQGDDIVRSKTVAKVTSTYVSETYSDGSYCVPCVLMAC